MDPDEALDEQRDLAEVLRVELDKEDGDIVIIRDETERLSDVFKDFDRWLMNGGFLPKEWALRCNGGFLKRAELAQRVHEEALAHTETFDGDFGVQLAYLFGAILKNDVITLDGVVAEEAEVLEFFQAIWPEDHPVWAHIQVAPLKTAAAS